MSHNSETKERAETENITYNCSIEDLISLIHRLRTLSRCSPISEEYQRFEAIMEDLDVWIFPRLISQLISIDYGQSKLQDQDKQIYQSLIWCLYSLIQLVPFPYTCIDSQLVRALMLEAIETSGVSGILLSLPLPILSGLEPSICDAEGHYLNKIQPVLDKIELLGSCVPLDCRSRSERMEKLEGRAVELLVKYKGIMKLKNLRRLPISLEVASSLE